MDFVGEFRSHIATFGLEVGDLMADGKIHRFGKNKNGWYVMFLDTDGAGGAFGDWGQGIDEKWSSFEKNDQCDPNRMARVMAQIEESKRKNEEEKIKRAAAAVVEAEKLWSNGNDVIKFHPYLIKKQVPGVGLKREHEANNLLVPMYAPGQKLVGIQRIMEDGSKKFLPGSTVKGSCCYLRGTINDRLYVCEGYATGESIHMATGRTVFIAFNANNLINVCKQVMSKTSVPVIVCGDDDVWTTRNDGTPYNAGRIAAEECRTRLGCEIVFPLFENTGQKPTDFNDLMCAEGVGRVTALTCDPWANREDKIKHTVKEWATSSMGKFSTMDIDRELGIITVEDKRSRDEAINELLKDGVLEHDDVKRNVYRSRDCTVNVIDLSTIKEDDSVSFFLPFDLGGVVSLSPRNIVMIAGEQNAGKTTLALEILRENLAMYGSSNKSFSYLTSEMSDEELKSTVLRFGKLKEFERCTFIDRQFEPYDLINGNKSMQDGFVFIDFLETKGGDYSKTVSEVQKIYDSMGKGIVVLLVQKQPGKDHAKGGSGMLEKPRLVINLEKRFKSDSGTVCVAKIEKCKSVYPGEINPDGKGLYYIVNEKGTTPITNWGILGDKTKDETDAILKAQLGVREYQGPTIDMQAVEGVRR